MRIGGGSDPLNSPLLWAILGTKALGGGSEIFRDLAYQGSQKAYMQGLLTGQVSPTLPGGFFRHLLSHTGLVSPDATATPQELMYEQLGARQYQKQDVQEAGTLAGIRGKTGGQLSGPIAAEANRLGVNPKQTPNEAKQAARDQQQVYTNRINAIRARVAVENLALNQQKVQQAKQNKFLDDYYHSIGYKKAVARATGESGAEGRTEAFLNEPISAHPEITYRDRSTGLDMSRRSPNVTGREALSKGWVQFRTPKQNENVDDILEMNQRLSQIKKIIPEVFPKAIGPGMGYTRALSNMWASNTNPKIAQMYAYTQDLIGFIKAKQGRYPSMSEIQLGKNFWPEMGSFEHWGKIARTDTQAVAFSKVDVMQKALKEALAVEMGFAGSGTDSTDYDSMFSAEISGVP